MTERKVGGHRMGPHGWEPIPSAELLGVTAEETKPAAKPTAKKAPKKAAKTTKKKVTR